MSESPLKVGRKVSERTRLAHSLACAVIAELYGKYYMMSMRQGVPTVISFATYCDAVEAGLRSASPSLEQVRSTIESTTARSFLSEFDFLLSTPARRTADANWPFFQPVWAKVFRDIARKQEAAGGIRGTHQRVPMVFRKRRPN